MLFFLYFKKRNFHLFTAPPRWVKINIHDTFILRLAHGEFLRYFIIWLLYKMQRFSLSFTYQAGKDLLMLPTLAPLELQWSELPLTMVHKIYSNLSRKTVALWFCLWIKENNRLNVKIKLNSLSEFVYLSFLFVIFSDENQCSFFSYNELKQQGNYLKKGKIGQELAPLSHPERQIVRCNTHECRQPWTTTKNP